MHHAEKKVKKRQSAQCCIHNIVELWLCFVCVFICRTKMGPLEKLKYRKIFTQKHGQTQASQKFTKKSIRIVPEFISGLSAPCILKSMPCFMFVIIAIIAGAAAAAAVISYLWINRQQQKQLAKLQANTPYTLPTHRCSSISNLPNNLHHLHQTTFVPFRFIPMVVLQLH